MNHPDLSLLKPGSLLNQIPSDEKINALSWRQPFATAMLHGKIETRTRKTNYRGLVLICTSKNPYDADSVIKIGGENLFKKLCRDMRTDTRTLDLDGYAIAIGELVDCRLMTKKDEPNTYVKYSVSLYCHVYKNVRPIEPFLWKGSQGFRYLTEDEKKKIILL